MDYRVFYPTALIIIFIFVMDKKIHQGRNIKRFREMLGKKQETMAAELGGDWTQKKVSLLEAKEEIEPGILQEVAKALKIPAAAIENFDEEAAINIVANTFSDEASAFAQNYKCTFNPLDKVVELYERQLKEKDDLIRDLLSKLPNSNK
jgi:transcriptional regulator with XRE-family HTH domain